MTSIFVQLKWEPRKKEYSYYYKKDKGVAYFYVSGDGVAEISFLTKFKYNDQHHPHPGNLKKCNFLIDRSKVVLLLWIFFAICVSCMYVNFLVCSLQPCGHLLGKGWPLGFHVCDVFLDDVWHYAVAN